MVFIVRFVRSYKENKELLYVYNAVIFSDVSDYENNRLFLLLTLYCLDSDYLKFFSRFFFLKRHYLAKRNGFGDMRIGQNRPGQLLACL